MKKVLIVIPSYSKGGGAEKILSNILNNGDFSEYKIDIVEIDRGKKGFEKLPKDISILKKYNDEKYPYLMRLILEQLGRRLPNLLRNYLIKKDDYDIEVSFTIMNPAFPFSKRAEVKKFAWIHGSIEAFLEENQAHYRKNHYEQLSHTDKYKDLEREVEFLHGLLEDRKK